MLSEIVYKMPEGGGNAEAIHICDAPEWNQKSFGIFWTVQEFKGGIRRKDQLTQINGFAIDIDTKDRFKTKEEILENSKKYLLPTMVIESKNGFHFYWFFESPLEISYSEDLNTQYRATVENIIESLGGDKNAKDLPRLLRVPYFKHLKDPTDPFMVTVRFENPCRYTWETINRFFNTKPKYKEPDAKYVRTKRFRNDYNACEDNLDQMMALQALSGRPEVNGEVYTFRKTASGNFNVYVNGKGTSCWIDTNKKIGTHSGSGGPTIIQWLNFFHYDVGKCYEIARNIFPNVFGR